MNLSPVSLLALCLLLISQTLGRTAVRSLEQKADGVLILTETDAIFLRPWSEATVQVQAAPGGLIPDKHSFAVVGEPQPGSWKLTDSSGTVEFASKHLRVIVDKSTGLLSFMDGNGKPLLRQVAWSFEPGKDPQREGLRPGATFKRDSEERFFGGGVIGNELQQPNAEINLQNDYLQIHLPMMFSNLGYGFFWDNPSRGKLRLTPETVRWESSAGDLADFFFFAGPSADNVVAEYRALTGPVALFPKWAYGFWFSKNKFNSQEEILKAAGKFRERRFPIDMIVQDYFYWKPSQGAENWTDWGTHEFVKDRYPDPKKMISELHNELHMHFMPVIWAKFDPSTAHGRELEDAGGLLPEHRDWAGQSLRYYDPFDKKARDIYARQVMDSLLYLGVDGFWMDGVEPEMNMDKFDGFETAAGSGSRVAAAFPLMHTEGIRDAQRERNSDKRVVLLPRSAWAGSQRNSTIAWTSDINMNWATLAWQIEGLQNFSILGLPYITTDIGGYGTTPENDWELFVRWFQWGTFSPIFRVHGATRPYPWDYGDKAEAILKDFTKLRYRLLPYIYTQAAQVSMACGTILRPLVMDFSDDRKSVDTWDEFLFGPSILVCPVYKSARESVATSGQIADLLGTPGSVSATFVPKDGQAAPGNGQSISMSLRNLSDDRVPGIREPQESFGLKNLTPEQMNTKLVRLEGTFTPRESGIFQIETSGMAFPQIREVSVAIEGQPVERSQPPKDWHLPAFPFKAEAGKPVKFAITSGMKNFGFRIVKPLPEPTRRDVYLPAGVAWYDFWTGKKFDGAASLSVETPIERIPLFVRAGSILPMGPDLQWAEEKSADPIELRVYRGADGEFSLYEDEGDGYGYEKGAHATIPIKWDEAGQTLTIGQRAGTFPGMLERRIFRVVWVKTGHGVGGDITTETDEEVAYAGGAVALKPKN